jgi:predicted phage terminase large subunit-like protein
MKSIKTRGRQVKEKKPPKITDKRLIFLKETILDNKYCIHKPTRKQTEFLLRQELEVLYGGAAAGGKSDALLMAALQYAWVPGYAALILRRTYADLALSGAIMDRSLQWLSGSDAHWDASGHKWTFPSGATLTFGYLESERDKYRYQSAEFQFIGFDELTQFTETQYSYLFSRLRRLKDVDVPLRMRSASNPGGVGHEWVKNRFKIDTGGDSSRPFIGAKLDDNPHVDQEAYEEALSKLDYVTREQLRRGDWTITHSGGIFFEPKTWPIKSPDINDNPELQNCVRYASCDPSEGGADYAAIGEVVRLPDGRLLVWSCDMAVDNQSDTIGKIIEFQRIFNNSIFWIEANSLGHAKGASGMSLFEKDLRARMVDAGVTVPFKFVWNTANKEARIRSMEPHYSNGTLLFRSDWAAAYPSLIQQLKAFSPDSKMHDDGPDMLEMAVSNILNESAAPICFVDSIDGPSVW